MAFLKNLFPKKADHPVFRNNRDYFAGLSQDKPLAEYEFVVFDTELTGLNPRRDEILAIGAVRIRNLRIIAAESFLSYVRPARSAVNKQILIHRITPEQLADAPAITEVLPEFLKFCGPSLLVGHAVAIDVAFVNRAAAKFFQDRIRNPCLDTMRLAQIYTDKSQEHYYDRYEHVLYDLQSLAERYALPRFAPHDALGDALQTAYLFLFLVKQLERFKLVTLRDFFNAGHFWRNII